MSKNGAQERVSKELKGCLETAGHSHVHEEHHIGTDKMEPCHVDSRECDMGGHWTPPTMELKKFKGADLIIFLLRHPHINLVPRFSSVFSLSCRLWTKLPRSVCIVWGPYSIMQTVCVDFTFCGGGNVRPLPPPPPCGCVPLSHSVE